MNVTHSAVFGHCMAGRETLAHWDAADADDLEDASAIVAACGADPWAFCGDIYHFVRFAGPVEFKALGAMTDGQIKALLRAEVETITYRTRREPLPRYVGYCGPLRAAVA